MATKRKSDPQSVVTGEVRLSFVSLITPRPAQDEDDSPSYGCLVLIPKSDEATLKKLRRAEKAAEEYGKTAKWNGKIPKYDSIIRDADEEWDDIDEAPEMKGHMFMWVKSRQRPGIVDRNVEPIIDPTEVYSGMYARLSLRAFPYAASGNKGVSFGLNHVQKVRDGEMLGGRTRAEDVFDELDDGDEEDDDLL